MLPLDLLVLTGGHRTLADSLLWSSAYAELQFSPRPWPDADADWFAGLLADYASRDRRFGGVRDVTVPTRRKVG